MMISGIRSELGWNFITNDYNPSWWHLGRIVQIKNTRVSETQDCIGIVWPGDSSEESRTWLSQIEDDGEKKYRAGFTKQSFDAYDQQKGVELFWNGYFDEIVQSYDSHNRQWRSADAWRGYSVCQRVGYILDFESHRKHASSFIVRKALRWKRIFLWLDQRSKTTSHQKRDSDTVQHGELRSCRGCQRVLPPVLILQLQWHFQDRRGIVQHLPRARHLHHLQQHQVTVGLEKEKIKMKLIPLQCLYQVQMLMTERWNPLFAVKPITSKPKLTKNSQIQQKGDHHRTEKPVVCRLRSSTVKFWNPGVAARI